jgi:hypothetical protein
MQAMALNFDTKLYNLAYRLDRARVKKHLMRVEQSLRKNTPKNMTAEQLAARTRTLDHFRDYWQQGEFPVNDLVDYRTPVFKDHFGTYCAVGNLFAKAGYDQYVTEIQDTNNLVRVKDIDDPKYLEVIDELGLTKQEAARIQPAYGNIDPYYTDPGDGHVAIFKLASLCLFILLQLFAIFFIKEMNLGRAQKVYGYLSLLSFSGLVMVAIWAFLMSY